MDEALSAIKIIVAIIAIFGAIISKVIKKSREAAPNNTTAMPDFDTFFDERMDEEGVAELEYEWHKDSKEVIAPESTMHTAAIERQVKVEAAPEDKKIKTQTATRISSTQNNLNHIDMRKAILYSEILKPKFKDYI